MRLTFDWYLQQCFLLPVLFYCFAVSATPAATPEISVPYLSRLPTIDGKLDEQVKTFPAQTFNHVWQFDNPKTEIIPVNYRLAYTASHLYLHISVASDKVIYRRRGFLWGDGYKVLIGRVNPEAMRQPLTREYFDIFVSPTPRDTQDSGTGKPPVSAFIGSYNFTGPRPKLSRHTRIAEYSADGTSGFEAAIAWQDIPPYHPFFHPRMAFNLYFAKAVEDFANGYAIVSDEGIWDEEIADRAYAVLNFQPPKFSKNSQMVASPDKKHIHEGEKVNIDVRSLHSVQDHKTLKVSIKRDDNTSLLQGEYTIPVAAELTASSFQLATEGIPKGHYQMVITDDAEYSETHPFTILPQFNSNIYGQKLLANEHHLPNGTVDTLMFDLNNIQTHMATLKSYEASAALIDQISRFRQEYAVFLAGSDPLMRRTSPYRRAFLSAQDATYQPYTLKLPNNYDPQRHYPLLVFLHGSGQDDRRLLDLPRSNGEFIEIAPFGRDKFRAYSEMSSQLDIEEAITDVSKHFRVDSERIVIGGFSMGGYGALRAFFHRPERYAAVAIFAGHPNLANEWLDGEYPDFTKPHFLEPFKDTPVFIYHGEKDPALPVSLARQLATDLSAAGAEVTTRFVPERGHQYQDETTHRIYQQWLSHLMSAPDH